MGSQHSHITDISELLKLYAVGERDFEQVNLIAADLHGRVLHGIDLSESLLNDANLQKADLRGADLSWADLSGANLQQADLRGAILIRADLSGANLRRANLLKADLSLASIAGANLDGATLPDGTVQTQTSEQQATLQFYYHPISTNARRVWIALLEKQVPFEPIQLNLDGDQFRQEFEAISPFNHVPALADGELNVIESLAILDYLEARYPTPPLMPVEPKAVAQVRMVEMVTVNELVPAMNPLIRQAMGFAPQAAQPADRAAPKVKQTLDFLTSLLGDRAYFGGDQLSLGDIVAGTAVPWLPELGIPLDEYPQLQQWRDRLMARESWQTTQPTPEAIETFKSQMQVLMNR
jgi:glutathione S-transferase